MTNDRQNGWSANGLLRLERFELPVFYCPTISQLEETAPIVEIGVTPTACQIGKPSFSLFGLLSLLSDAISAHAGNGSSRLGRHAVPDSRLALAWHRGAAPGRV